MKEKRGREREKAQVSKCRQYNLWKIIIFTSIFKKIYTKREIFIIRNRCYFEMLTLTMYEQFKYSFKESCFNLLDNYKINPEPNALLFLTKIQSLGQSGFKCDIIFEGGTAQELKDGGGH